jgi:hypothetical protein
MLKDNARAFHNKLDTDTTIANDFRRHFAELFRTLISQQTANAKGPLRYITMSFLKSGVVAETYEIATACHTADLYIDETETETYWRMNFLKEMIDRDMSAIVPNLKKKIFRLRGYEIEEFRVRYAYVYMPLLLTFFNRVLPRVLELPEFSAVKKESRVDVSFGGYMEEALQLVSYGKEGA